jgi:addiction module HigA family antidote
MIRVHPGEILAEELASRNMSANALALKMRVPANRITEIINGKRSVSPETALRLGKAFGTGPDLWLRLQSSYDLQEAQKAVGAVVEREVEALDS